MKILVLFKKISKFCGFIRFREFCEMFFFYPLAARSCHISLMSKIGQKKGKASEQQHFGAGCQ